MKPVEAAAAETSLWEKDDNTLLTPLWTVADGITFHTFNQGFNYRVTPPCTMNLWQLGREMERGAGGVGDGGVLYYTPE